MQRMSTLQLANSVALVITLVINFLSQSASVFGLKLFPFTVAELGESRAIFFLPAGYVFGIWGIIYLGLVAFVIYQGRAAQRANPIQEQIGPWFIVSCIANAGWLILFLNDLVAASTIAMLILLGSLLVIYLRLGIGRTQPPRGEFWAVHVPFSIYLGWITVATVANIAAMLYQAGAVEGFAGLRADAWAVIMMSVAVIVTAGMLVTRRDIAFGLVVVWSLVGIFARPFDTPVFAPVAAQNIALVDTAALVLAVLVALGAGARLVLGRRLA